tara:strand:- start:316 stop:546 length:231 start_codon:yes stop_codon:yes gene_type:complete
MTEEEEKQLKQYLTSEMVSRITLAEAINIMHKLAIEEVNNNVDSVMSEEEKVTALDELKSKLKASEDRNTEEQSVE